MLKATVSKKTASINRAKYKEKTISCLNIDFVKQNYNHYKNSYAYSSKGDNLINYSIEHINNTGLSAILHYEDVSSMQNSIEMRSPFMDYRLMEFAFSIPDNAKFDMARTKKIIRSTIGKELPDNIVNNYKKLGFETPFMSYLKDPLFADYIQKLINSDSFNKKSIWNASAIREKFNNVDKYPNFPFWRIINFEVWSKMNNITNL